MPLTFGAPHRHFRIADSTNARARELAERGAPGGTVVTAAEQTAGRGRQGRVWTAPPGGALLYSAILRPLDERHLLLPLAVPVAVCEAAEELEPGIECEIKWPNDVWLEGRKLAGVLIEAHTPFQGSAGAGGPETGPGDDRRGWAVIGVGLNLAIEPDEFPPDLRDRAISLATVAPSASPAPSLSHTEGRNGEGNEASARAVPLPTYAGIARAREMVDERLGRWVAAAPDTILTAWRERDALRGREVAWEGGSGVADGIDDRGRLAVVVPAGERVLLGAGEVHLGA
jgi:BirA family transcriptional regulator, biotin operon repressor / biotin---[acetyl-CoA-carboxylase] ligase